ncbi:DUF302 domain-containing protein [Stappia sp. TSB10P1A]|uniref:DUF302 domain-containing protein n=1 Tax=Stappia sp. TSB10P1A TaxID=2003585 RepID=UPI001643DC27|nr:DUF302 domain-containing protein [Stappia sp. TSB10P1A]
MGTQSQGQGPAWRWRLAAGLMACAISAPAMAADGPQIRQVERAYEDVRFDLENAIINRGLVIDHVSNVGEMLARTGADVGSQTEVFVSAEAMLFCSARLSRAAMEAAPENVAFCPYSVFLYETPDAPGTVSVGYRPLPEAGSEASRAAIAEVNALLAGIVEEASGE